MKSLFRVLGAGFWAGIQGFRVWLGIASGLITINPRFAFKPKPLKLEWLRIKRRTPNPEVLSLTSNNPSKHNYFGLFILLVEAGTVTHVVFASYYYSLRSLYHTPDPCSNHEVLAGSLPGVAQLRLRGD